MPPTPYQHPRYPKMALLGPGGFAFGVAASMAVGALWRTIPQP